MSDSTFFRTLIQKLYTADILDLHPFSESFVDDLRVVFRVSLTTSASYVLRAYRSEAPVPDWLVGCDATTQAELLMSRAATLTYLADHHYVAPRVIPTQTGQLIGMTDGWCTLVTTFIDGDVIAATPTTLQQLGAALGRLHTLDSDLDPSAPVLVGKSWWYPDLVIPAVLAQYAEVTRDAPAVWRSFIEACCTTLHTIQMHPDLPRAIIHGDAWVGNAIQAVAGGLVLIDWEAAGQGIAILDVGRLLLYGHLDRATSLATPIQPVAWRINAIIDGYCEERTPIVAERAVLVESIRFGIAVSAASHFVREQRRGWDDPAPQRLTRRQQWYAVSEEIADLAQRRFAALIEPHMKTAA
jgi:Ser/Thr protein kinase RdoA (MazF antagonist)